MGKQVDKKVSKSKPDGKKAPKSDFKKNKSTMKMQKKHQKSEVAVKDIQLKVGPTKHISKVAKAPQPTPSAAAAPLKPTKKTVAPAAPAEPLV